MTSISTTSLSQECETFYTDYAPNGSEEDLLNALDEIKTERRAFKRQRLNSSGTRDVLEQLIKKSYETEVAARYCLAKKLGREYDHDRAILQLRKVSKLIRKHQVAEDRLKGVEGLIDYLAQWDAIQFRYLYNREYNIYAANLMRLGPIGRALASWVYQL